MRSLLVRFLARERGLFAGAVIIAATAAALGVPFEFMLFALTLAGVALFHHHTLQVALAGLAVVTLYKLGFAGFKTGPGFGGLVLHLAHEWMILANLLGLLLGFALLSKHFEESNIPAELPKFLPDDWKGGFLLLVIVFVLSSFLDVDRRRESAGGVRRLHRRRRGAHRGRVLRGTPAARVFYQWWLATRHKRH